MNYEKYIIKKDKLDLLSSLKALDKKIINKKLREYDLANINELKEYIIEEFEMCLDMSKDDELTIMYFMRLLEHENTEWMSAYQEDIEELLVFVYKNENHYSYYIPTEIKEIIVNMLKEMSTDEQINLQNAANTPIIKDLKEILKTLTIKDLRHIGDLFLVNRLSNKPKKELISIIYDTLTNETKLFEVIERFIDKEFNLLKKLMDNKGTIQDNNISMYEYHFLYITGMVFLFKRENKFYVSMTDDVYNILKKMNIYKLDKIIEDNTKVYNLVKAMTELYGVVSYSELFYCYSLYYGNGEDMDIPENALYFCDRIDNIEIIHTQHNLYYVNSILRNEKLESLLDDIVERKEIVKRREIKLEELLKYLDQNYYEDNDSKYKFKKYLKQNNVSDETIEEIILTISKMYRLGHSFIGGAIGMLQEYGLEITDDNLEEILNYLNNIYNNTRIWSNNGWTPIEMRKNFEENN